MQVKLATSSEPKYLLCLHSKSWSILTCGKLLVEPSQRFTKNRVRMVSNGVIRIRPKRYEAVTVWAENISKMLALVASGTFCNVGLPFRGSF